jgi:two-component system LytT family response regulator
MLEVHGQDRAPVVVFLTAYDQYAIQAFESGAVDYLLKPFSDERFAKALDRAKRQISQRRLTAGSDGEAPRPHGRLERLLVRSLGTITFVRAEEIDWIEAADYYAVVHTGGKEHLVRISMRRLERSLDARAFVRVHRNAIVRIDRIRGLRQDREGALEVELHDGTRVAVSRRLRDRLRDRVLRGD